MTKSENQNGEQAKADQVEGSSAPTVADALAKTAERKSPISGLPDAQVVSLNAKELRELGLDKELEIDADVPDYRPCKVSVGKLRKAGYPKRGDA